MPSTQQFAYFFAFIGSGLVFMVIAFSIFLPVIVIAPSKFALSFTIGSLLVMAGFAALRGLKQQATHMLSAPRLPFTAGKVNSLAYQRPPVCLQPGDAFATAGIVCVGLLQLHETHDMDDQVDLPAGYLITMFGTLYAALVMHSYIMSLICCALQVRCIAVTLLPASLGYQPQNS